MHATKLLGTGSFAVSHGITPPTTKPRRTNPKPLPHTPNKTHHDPQVGGQLILIAPTWGTAVISTHTDRSGLSVITHTTLRAATRDILLIGTYWPNKPKPKTQEPNNSPPQSNSLHNKLQSFLHSTEKYHGSPLDWIQTNINLLSSKHQSKPKNVTILCGDFNSRWYPGPGGTNGTLAPWATLNDWHNGPAALSKHHNIDIPTHYRQDQPTSTIDHILTSGDPSGLTVTGHLSTYQTAISQLSDHRLIWATFTTPGGRGNFGTLQPHHPKPQHKTPNPNPILDLSHKEKITNYQTELLNLSEQVDFTTLDPEQTLRKLSSLSQTALQLTQDPRKRKVGYRSPYKDGYSPTLIAHKHHLLALIEIRRHLTGQAKRAKWRTHHNFHQGIHRITTHWEKSVLKVLPAKGTGDKNPYTVMNITRHDPQHLRTLSPEYLTVTTIDAQIDELKHRLHGITRTALRQQINENTKAREELREQGKLRRVIKSILGQHDLHNDLSTLRTPHPTDPDNHTITTDPEQIHNHLTTAHGKIFNTPPHHSNSPLQHPDVDWHRALTDQTYFNSVNSHHNIPQHLLDLIWKGMQAVPNKQSLDAEMAHSFAQPPTLDEFHNAIKHISSNTAPGMSNLTNNEIKSWPDATKLIAYDALSKLWATHTIPSDWQWRWTCLKPKSTDPHLQPEEFRPLTLIDCIRKVWEKIILHRINQIWHKHSTLSPLQHCQRGKGTDSALLQRIAVTEAAQEAALDLYTSSWDFRKAFDSVSKPIIRLAWTRLGVPPDAVE
eukprot:gene36599-45138_t